MCVCVCARTCVCVCVCVCVSVAIAGDADGLNNLRVILNQPYRLHSLEAVKTRLRQEAAEKG